MELRVDRARGLRRHAGHALELLLARGEHALGRAEVLDQRPPPRRADALERVEERLARPRRPPLAVEVEREAVRLVANALQQLQPGAVRVEQDRIGPPGTNTSSIRFASEITATRGSSYACIAASAADSCPLPPSITTRFGAAANPSS